MGMKDLITGNSVWTEILIFVLGAGAYGMFEILFRGYTHWTMLLTGGACVLTMYYLQEWIFEQPLVIGALAGAIIITFYEFFVGVLVNLRFGWNVWDYSAIPGNVLGQICPLFTGIWFCLCFAFFGAVKLIMHLSM